MAKRGRKPKEKQQTGYFCEREETAVVDYLKSDSAEVKNEIYNSILRPAFEKLVESIIRRYKLYVPGEEFTDTFNDALSFILMKFDKFNMDGTTKAFSYYGTICKNYIIGRIVTQANRVKRNPSYGLSSDVYNNDIKYSNETDKGREVAREVVTKLIDKITEMTDNPEANDL